MEILLSLTGYSRSGNLTVVLGQYDESNPATIDCPELAGACHSCEISFTLPFKRMEDDKIPPDPDAAEDPGQPDEERLNCLNCNRKLPKKAKFCPRCGQRNNKGKVSMRELLQRFWANFSHLDGKFVKICWQLFIPAHVTLEYFRGRQKRYPNPVQFFLIVMFFFLLAVRSGSEKNDGTDEPVTIRVDSSSGNNRVNINIKPGLLYPVIERYVVGKEFRQSFDSISPDLSTPAMRRRLDSLLYASNADWNKIAQLWMNGGRSGNETKLVDSIPLTLGYFVLNVSVDDLVKLEPGEIARKYEVHDWLRKTFLIQGIKSFKNPEGLARHYLGSLTWTLLALVSFMSVVLIGLYRRQKRYFVEHFVFLLHIHSAVLLSAALVLGVANLTKLQWLPILLVPLSFAYLFSAMKRFYGEGVGRTTLKWLFFSFIHIVFFFIFFAGGLMAVILLF